MIGFLLIGFSYILPLGLGYFVGYIHGYKICDNEKFEKRWEDSE